MTAPPVWRDEKDKRVLRVAAALSAGAALAHGLLTPAHFEEWVGYGVFFFLAGFAQAFYALLILLQPWRYHPELGPRPNADATTRRFYQWGIIGNILLVAMYVVSRTVGVPLFGPQAGRVEAWGVAGLLTKGLELALIGCLLWLLRPLDRRA